MTDTNTQTHRGLDIPTNLIASLSGYEMANSCFAHQRFSEKLQTFLVNYTYNISSYLNQNG